MTTVTFDIDVDTAAGLAAADGAIRFTPWPGARVEASKLVMPAGFSQKIPSAATFSVDLPPTTEAWAWRVQIETRAGGGRDIETFYVQVPSSGTHDFTSLAQVDPKSLEPGAEPGPAWSLALAELASRVDEFEGANPEVIEQAVSDFLDANPISGLPVGGTTGQVLAKASGDDADAEWVEPPAGTWGDLDGKPAVIAAGADAAEARDEIGAASADDLDSLESTAVPKLMYVCEFDGTDFPARPAGAAVVVWVNRIDDTAPAAGGDGYAATDIVLVNVAAAE